MCRLYEQLNATTLYNHTHDTPTNLGACTIFWCQATSDAQLHNDRHPPSICVTYKLSNQQQQPYKLFDSVALFSQ